MPCNRLLSVEIGSSVVILLEYSLKYELTVLRFPANADANR